MKPKTPNITIAKFFHSFQLYLPIPSKPNVKNSIIGGNITASDDENTAPNKEMIGPNFGTTAAKITVIDRKKNKNRKLEQVNKNPRL